MGEWKPIETAPKDGTEILVSGPLYNDITQGRYRSTAVFREDGWYDNGDAAPDDRLWEPTHWMELPDFPE